MKARVRTACVDVCLEAADPYVGLYSYGQYGYGPYSYGLHSYGLYSYGADPYVAPSVGTGMLSDARADMCVDIR